MTDPSRDAVETARYRIFMNETDKHVIVLQFPHLGRDRPFTQELGNKPVQLRVKPKNGIVELDVPLPDTRHINKDLAVKYGLAVNQHKTITNDAPVGLAGGFGAANPSRVKRQDLEHEREDVLIADFENSMGLGKAMNFLTLTGQINLSIPGDSLYYLGSFTGDELHLTKISAFCSMRPGLHHIDAMDLVDKANKRAQLDEGGSTDKAVAVGMQVKNVEEIKTEETEWKRKLRELQEEPWQKLEWIDESADQSYDFFHQGLFLKDDRKSNRILAVMSREQYTDSLSATGTSSAKLRNPDGTDPWADSSSEDEQMT